jgi:hypothetical protein
MQDKAKILKDLLLQAVATLKQTEKNPDVARSETLSHYTAGKLEGYNEAIINLNKIFGLAEEEKPVLKRAVVTKTELAEMALSDAAQTEKE